ncbi:MAG: hypothetical protein ACYCUY_11315 [Acidithiobacillus sp.]
MDPGQGTIKVKIASPVPACQWPDQTSAKATAIPPMRVTKPGTRQSHRFLHHDCISMDATLLKVCEMSPG